MRHRKRRTRFGRQSTHRIATLKSLARSVLIHQSIKTTRVKAKEASRVVDGLITIAKKKSPAARRQAFSMLGDKTLVRKLFKEIAPLFEKRKGGYTRITPFDFRKGDGASMVFLELTEKKPEEKAKPPKKAKSKPLPKAAPEIKPAVKEEKTVEDVRKEKAKDEQKKFTRQKGFFKNVSRFFRRRTNM